MTDLDSFGTCERKGIVHDLAIDKAVTARDHVYRAFFISEKIFWELDDHLAAGHSNIVHKIVYTLEKQDF